MLNATQNKSFHQCNKYDQGIMVLIEFSLKALKLYSIFLGGGRGQLVNVISELNTKAITPKTLL